MKILYLHQYFATRDSSTGTRSYEFARLLQKMGHEVDIVTGSSQLSHLVGENSKYYEFHNINGINVHIFKNTYKNKFSKWRRIYSFIQFLFSASFLKIKNKQFDIVFATSTPLTIAVPARVLARRYKIPFVFEVRDLWPEAPYQLGYIKNKFLYKALSVFAKQTYNKAQGIVALSPGMKEGIMKYNIPEEKIKVIPNCADVDFFQTNENLDIRAKYNLSDDIFILAHIGSMGVINGLEYVIDAAVELEKVYMNKVVILLTGDGGQRRFLERKVAELKLTNIIFTGKIPKYQVPLLMKEVDATIMSVKNEPILEMASPNKFFDSLAAGKPTLVNCAGWMKNIIQLNKAGFFVRPDYPCDVVSAVKEIKADIANNYGKNALRVAQTQFNREDAVKQLEIVLKEAVERG